MRASLRLFSHGTTVSPMRDARGQCLLLAGVMLGVLAAACAPPRYATTGQVAGQVVDTTVDAEIARIYLEQYLTRASAREDLRLREVLVQADRAPLSNELLQRLTEEYSSDFATLYLLDRTYRDGFNFRLQSAFFDRLEAFRTDPRGRAPSILPEHLQHLLVFVPGFAYKTDPTTGADFARQRRLLNRAGFETVLVETDEQDSVERNAKIVAREIVRLSGEDRPIVLISASKGGPEVALALGRGLPPHQSRRVVAWISIGGLLRGSPYADWVWKWPRSWLARIAFRYYGLDPSVIPNLRTSVRRPAFDALVFPEHILLLQYVGAPLSGHIKKHVRGRYKVIRKIGPNDGLTLLLDELISGGGVITDIGLDHFYRDPEIDLKTLALAVVVLEELRRRSKMK